MENKLTFHYTEELVEALLSKQDVDTAAKQIMGRKKDECNAYCRGIQEEQDTLGLLIKSLEMPTGSAGKILADAIVEQLRKDYPDAARKADECLAKKIRLGAEEIERICRH
ncbi:MAG: hypothetical protein IJ662_06495 [Clostridia bacterium]|nr:hypothetical protein [Clostridia bacterium]